MLRAYGDDVYGLKPHVGHFLQVSRLEDGRLLTGGGPQLPELPKLRKVG